MNEVMFAMSLWDKHDDLVTAQDDEAQGEDILKDHSSKEGKSGAFTRDARKRRNRFYEKKADHHG